MARLRTLTFKVTADEEASIRRLAKSEHRSVSDYLRKAAIPAKKPKSPKLVLKRHPLSGGWYNAAPGQASPSLQELKSAMEDFP